MEEGEIFMAELVTVAALDRFTKSEREETVYSFRPDFVRALFGTFAGLATIAFILAATFALPHAPLPPALRSFHPLLVLPLWMILPVWWVKYHFTNYTLTTQRLIMRTGIVMRETDEVELYRVKDLKCMRSLLNRITGIGTVQAVTTEVMAGQPGMLTLLLTNIRNADQVRDLMRNLTEAVRLRRGVRETDINVHG
jgi:uncharacterized membrane protein YdbT with pleckstrin-like domain